MLKIASEPLDECSAELAPLMEELAALAVVPCRPHSIDALKRAGAVVFTMREPEGRMVGFCLATRLQDGATDHGMFIRPEYRGSCAAIRMVGIVQEAMRAAGAKWFVWDCDDASGSNALARRLGHRLIGTRWLANLEH